MKVICIVGIRPGQAVPGNALSKVCLEGEGVVEGNTYTVTAHTNMSEYETYTLLEKPGYCHYSRYRFIPLSTIDEKEFERNYNKELV